MKRLFHFLATATGVTFVAVSPCAGQSGDKVSVRAAMLPGVEPEVSLELYPDEGGESEPVIIGQGRFSPEFQLTRSDLWRFGNWEVDVEDGEDEGAGRFNEQARVVPPDSENIWLVFFRPDAGEETPLEVQAFGVDEAALGDGGVVVLNYAEVSVEVEIHGEKHEIESKARKFIKAPAENVSSYPVKFYFSHNDRFRPFVATNWSGGDRRRRLAVVVQEEGASAPKLLVVDDVMSRTE